MSDFEKKYYESDEFWKQGVVADEGNMGRIHATVGIIPGDVTSLADIGCGNGAFGNMVMEKKNSINVMCIDRSEQALTYVKTNKEIGDITSVPLPDNSYDCVSCLQVLEHIPVNNYHKALSELTRVSKNYIIVSVPFNEKIENNVTQCPACKTIFNADLHLRSYSEKDIRELFTQKGFELAHYVNVVEQKTFIGIKQYYKFKNIFRKKKPVFHSPICPICGFENSSFHILPEGTINGTAVPAKQSGSGLKGWLKSIWPKKTVPGYWAIALYKKKQATHLS